MIREYFFKVFSLLHVRRLLGVFVITTLFFLLSACAQRDGDNFFDVERFEAAADLYIEAAEQGDIKKMLRLAQMYAAGKIAYRRNYPQSVYWYQKAAGLGVVSAMFELGLIFEYGLGRVDKDSSQAIHWYQQAADHGHAYAQYRLAGLLSRQLSDRNSDAAIQAYSWFLIAERSAQRCKPRPECRLVVEDLFNYHWQLQQALSVEQQILAQGQADAWQLKSMP